MLENLRQELWQLHLELPKNNLVTWTGGNVSGRDPQSGLVVIKPSGIRYEDLQPEHMVVVDLDGKIVEGTLKPSSDTASHLYIYRQRPDVNGVVHTHSPYATAFAALGRPIPVYLTALGDEFGGPIPCAGFALIGGEEIGKLVVDAHRRVAGRAAQEPRRLHHRRLGRRPPSRPPSWSRTSPARSGSPCRSASPMRSPPTSWPSCTTATRTSTGSSAASVADEHAGRLRYVDSPSGRLLALDKGEQARPLLRSPSTHDG